MFAALHTYRNSGNAPMNQFDELDPTTTPVCIFNRGQRGHTDRLCSLLPPTDETCKNFPQPIDPSDIINVHLLVVATVIIIIVAKLDVVVPALLAVGVRLVDLGALWQLAISLQRSSLVGTVLEDDIALFVLVVAKR
jgi:hypothetical protein